MKELVFPTCLTSQTTLLQGPEERVHISVKFACTNLSIEFDAFTKGSYLCSALKDCTLIEFEIVVINSSSNTYSVTILHRAGCSYTYNLVVLDFVCTLRGVTPPLLTSVVPLPKLDDSLYTKVCRILFDGLNSKDSEEVVRSLRALGATAVDTEPFFLFETHTVPLVERTVEIFKKNSDKTVRATAMAVLANVAAVPNHTFVDLLYPVVLSAIDDPSLHVRREAMGAMCGLVSRSLSVATLLYEEELQDYFVSTTLSPDPYITLYGVFLVRSIYRSFPCHSEWPDCAQLE